MMLKGFQIGSCHLFVLMVSCHFLEAPSSKFLSQEKLEYNPYQHQEFFQTTCGFYGLEFNASKMDKPQSKFALALYHKAGVDLLNGNLSLDRLTFKQRQKLVDEMMEMLKRDQICL